MIPLNQKQEILKQINEKVESGYISILNIEEETLFNLLLLIAHKYQQHMNYGESPVEYQKVMADFYSAENNQDIAVGTLTLITVLRQEDRYSFRISYQNGKGEDMPTRINALNNQLLEEGFPVTP